MACKGVDLTHPQWIMASARVVFSDHKQQLVPLDQSPVADWPTDLVLDKDRSFWKRIGQSLGLDKLGAELPDDTE